MSELRQMQQSLGTVSEEALQYTKKLFEEFDFDSDGAIQIDELRLLLKSMGEEPSDEELLRIFESVDTSGDGHIDFPEFMRFMSEFMDTSDSKKALKDAFFAFDDDYDGLISKNELKIAIRAIDRKSSEEKIEAVIGLVAEDAENGIGFVEFSEILSMLRDN